MSLLGPEEAKILYSNSKKAQLNRLERELWDFGLSMLKEIEHVKDRGILLEGLLKKLVPEDEKDWIDGDDFNDYCQFCGGKADRKFQWDPSKTPANQMVSCHIEHEEGCIGREAKAAIYPFLDMVLPQTFNVVSEYGSCGSKQMVDSVMHTCKFRADHSGDHLCGDCDHRWFSAEALK